MPFGLLVIFLIIGFRRPIQLFTKSDTVQNSPYPDISYGHLHVSQSEPCLLRTTTVTDAPAFESVANQKTAVYTSRGNAVSNVEEHLIDEDSHDLSSSSSSSYCSTCDGSSSEEELVSPSQSRSSSNFVSPVTSSSDLCQIIVQISPQETKEFSPQKTVETKENEEGEAVFKKPKRVSFDDVYTVAENNEENNDSHLLEQTKKGNNDSHLLEQTESEDPLDNLNGESVDKEGDDDVEIINVKNDGDG